MKQHANRSLTLSLRWLALAALAISSLGQPAPTQAAPNEGGPIIEAALPENLITADGTLNLDGNFSGTLDLEGWTVNLDPVLGPVFAPEQATVAAASPGEWADLGYGSGDINEDVSAAVVMGGNLYIGGSFRDAGNDPTADYIAMWDGSNWHGLGNRGWAEGPVNNRVAALATDGTYLFVGGNFTNVYQNYANIPAADYVAKWDGTNWSALGSNGSGNGSLTNVVYALAVSGSNLYVGGTFTNVNNDGTVLGAADYIAKWDGTNWSALGSNGASNGSLPGGSVVYALAVIGSNVYAGGDFTNVNNNGTPIPEADNIAKWDGTDWSALGSNGSGDGSLTSQVKALAVSGSNLYVGGFFINVNNSGSVLGAADYVAKWDGTNWSALGSNGSGNGSLNGSVVALAVSGSNVYVGGWFTNVNDGGSGLGAADYIAKWDGTNWSALGSNGASDGSLSNGLEAIAVDGSDVYVGGYFAGVNDGGILIPHAQYVASWDGSNWAAIGSVQGPLSQYVSALAVIGSDVYVAGQFVNISDHGVTLFAADYIARWDGANWHALGHNGNGNGALNGTVYALSVSGSDLYVGGWFIDVTQNSVSMPQADYVARWDGSNWSALGSNGSGNGALGSGVAALAVDGAGNLYAGGTFTNVNNGGVVLGAADYVAKWDGTNWSALGSNGSGNGSFASGSSINALAILGSDLYVGGYFTNVNNGGISLGAADYIAKWDGTNWSALGSNGGGDGSLNSDVAALAVIGSDLYAGGYFWDVNNGGSVLGAADYVAKWDGTNWSALGSNGSGGGSVNDAVLALTARGTDLYVGGYFWDVNNGVTAIPEADYVAKWNGTNWSALGSNGSGNGSIPRSTPSALVRALATTTTELIVGGYFWNVNNGGTVLPYADHIAAYGLTPMPDTVGIHSGDTFYLRDANAAGPADHTFGFGWSGPAPVVGDWDGDDIDTIGIYDAGWFFLRNANSGGAADEVYQYGWSGVTPLMGDWDGNGTDTPGIYSAGWFFLRNSNSPGPADMVFSFGWDGPTPIVGDWDGDGMDTIGIHAGDTFFLRNSNSPGPADVTFSYGWSGPTPIVGDWDGDGDDTIGIVSSGTFYLRDTNSAGPADTTFGFGWAGPTPLAGTWDLIP